MANNESFKVKELDKKDYAKKETAAKAIKGTATAVGAVIVPQIIKGIISLFTKQNTKS